MKRGKRYRALREQIDRTREYPPAEAIASVRAMQSAKFTEAVEAHIRLGVNVRHADQQVRGTMTLPNGLGKEVRVVVFAQGDKAREAEAAGAEAVGGEDLAERVTGGWTDFDDRKLLENYAALIDEIVRAKPAAAKGRYIRSVTLTTTMGPGIHVDPTKTRDLLEEAA